MSSLNNTSQFVKNTEMDFHIFQGGGGGGGGGAKIFWGMQTACALV